MQRLIDGVHKFRAQEFGRYRELFRKLSREGQNSDRSRAQKTKRSRPDAAPCNGSLTASTSSARRNSGVIVSCSGNSRAKGRTQIGVARKKQNARDLTPRHATAH